MDIDGGATGASSEGGAVDEVAQAMHVVLCVQFMHAAAGMDAGVHIHSTPCIHMDTANRYRRVGAHWGSQHVETNPGGTEAGLWAPHAMG